MTCMGRGGTGTQDDTLFEKVLKKEEVAKKKGIPTFKQKPATWEDSGEIQRQETISRWTRRRLSAGTAGERVRQNLRGSKKPQWC